jgi:hypothetical protein
LPAWMKISPHTLTFLQTPMSSICCCRMCCCS